MTAASARADLSDAQRQWAHMRHLTPPQRRVFADPARFIVAVAGRRSGKTSGIGVNSILYHAQRKRKAKVWYVGPTYRMAKGIMWEVLKDAIPTRHIADKDESDMMLRLAVSQSTISLKGAEEYDSLRGHGLDHLLMDEFADCHEEAWTEVLRPALADHKGSALFIGTPRGFNWGYDLFIKAKARANWSAHQWTTEESGTIDPEELAAAREEMDPRIYRQEFEASFESLSGRVYSNFDRNLNVDGMISEQWDKDLLFGVDFNVNPMSVVVAQQGPNGECWVLYEHEILASNTEEMAQELTHQYAKLTPEHRHFNRPPRRFTSFPDPSGKSRRTSAPIGQTDLTILQRAGFRVEAPPAAPPVVDRINAVQTRLLNAAGQRTLKIHPRCVRLIKCLDGLTYKPKTSLVDKSAGLDHLPDALGYMVWSAFNTLKSRKLVAFDPYA